MIIWIQFENVWQIVLIYTKLGVRMLLLVILAGLLMTTNALRPEDQCPGPFCTRPPFVEYTSAPTLPPHFEIIHKKVIPLTQEHQQFPSHCDIHGCIFDAPHDDSLKKQTGPPWTKMGR